MRRRWTNHEIRRLEAMHAAGQPTLAELEFAFPRHSGRSILATAHKLGFRRRRLIGGAPPALNWLRIAHQHFARREAGFLA